MIHQNVGDHRYLLNSSRRSHSTTFAASRSKLFTKSRTVTGMDDSQEQQSHDAEDRFRLRSSSDVWQPHQTAGIVAVINTKAALSGPPVFQRIKELGWRWVVMEMHLSLMMPNPGTPPWRSCHNFRWLLCEQVATWEMHGNFVVFYQDRVQIKLRKGNEIEPQMRKKGKM